MNLQKNCKCRTERERDILDEFDDIFDIEQADALKMIEVEED